MASLLSGLPLSASFTLSGFSFPQSPEKTKFSYLRSFQALPLHQPPLLFLCCFIHHLAPDSSHRQEGLHFPSVKVAVCWGFRCTSLAPCWAQHSCIQFSSELSYPSCYHIPSYRSPTPPTAIFLTSLFLSVGPLFSFSHRLETLESMLRVHRNHHM